MLGMIQCRNDKDALKNYFKQHQMFFGNLDYDSYEVVRVLLSSKMKLKEIPEEEYKKEGKDMCQALEDIYIEGVEEGISQGEDKMGRLIKLLFMNSRVNEVDKVVNDKEYRQKLYEEFQIV